MKWSIGVLFLVGFVIAVVFVVPGDVFRTVGPPTRVFFADNISPTHQRAIDLFNERHRGRIEVVPVNLPFEKFTTNERKELLARSLRSRSEKLDVFAVDLIWVPRFAKWSEPLDQYFSPDDRNRLLSFALQSCIYQDAFVAAPLYIDIGLMYYRRDLVAKLPDAPAIQRALREGISWDEMLRLRSRLRYGTHPFYLFQGKDYEGLVCNFLEMAVAEDSAYAGTRTLDMLAPAAVKALNAMVGLVETGIAPPSVVEYDENLSYTAMLDHDAFAVRGWPNFIENFRSFYPDSAKLLAIERAPVPRFPGGRSRSVFGGWNLMVARSSTRKAEAVEFIKFLQSDEIQRLLFEQGGYIPILGGVYADSAFLNKHDELRLYRRLLAQGFHRPAMVDYTRISDVVSQCLNRALRRELLPEDALRQADEMIRSGRVVAR